MDIKNMSCEEIIAALEAKTERESNLTRPDPDLRLAFDCMIDGVQCNDIEYLRALDKDNKRNGRA